MNQQPPNANNLEVRCTTTFTAKKFYNRLRSDIITQFSDCSRLLQTQAYVLIFLKRGVKGRLSSQGSIDVEIF